jgi:hypothetical protein
MFGKSLLYILCDGHRHKSSSYYTTIQNACRHHEKVQILATGKRVGSLCKGSQQPGDLAWQCKIIPVPEDGCKACHCPATFARETKYYQIFE